MSLEKIIAIVVVGLLLALAAGLLVYRKPKKISPKKYRLRWRTIQSTLKDKKLWPMAVIDADALLNEVLKKRKFAGKTMGERLVSAQKIFSSHDDVWAAHKLRNAIAHGETKTLKEDVVKQAMIAFRQALKDLGAL